MFCSNCGQKLPDSSKFCGNCGSKVVSNVVSNVANQVNNSRVANDDDWSVRPANFVKPADAVFAADTVNAVKKKKKMPLIVKLLITVSVVAVIAVTLQFTGIIDVTNINNTDEYISEYCVREGDYYIDENNNYYYVGDDEAQGYDTTISYPSTQVEINTYDIAYYGDSSNPEEVVKKMFYCMNTGDMEGLIDCFEPAMKSQTDALSGFMFGITEMVTGIDFSSLMPALGNYAVGAAGGEMKLISVTSSNYVYEPGVEDNKLMNLFPWLKEQKATDCDVTFKYTDGGTTTIETVHVHKFGSDGWRIDSGTDYNQMNQDIFGGLFGF